MPAFRLSAKSLEDLKSIGRFTLKFWGREQRNIYLSKLDESFHRLCLWLFGWLWELNR